MGDEKRSGLSVASRRRRLEMLFACFFKGLYFRGEFFEKGVKEYIEFAYFEDADQNNFNRLE